jgi:hypothetical protein
VRLMQLRLLLLRADTRAWNLQSRWLNRRNQVSRASVVALGGPVVSLTSYGDRIQTVHLAIESIAAGSLLPSRLILWLDDAASIRNAPAPLRRLESRGLEICLTENVGPHCKYYPYLKSKTSFDHPLVVADDDALYPRSWLRDLSEAHDVAPQFVHCHRAHVLKLENGHIAPYNSWTSCQGTEPSFTHFGTGVSGCIYPAVLQARIKAAGQSFLQLCPKADDVWLHVNALRAGFKTRQIRDRGMNYPTIPGTSSTSLYLNNLLRGGNDQQISSTYNAEDIERLKRD